MAKKQHAGLIVIIAMLLCTAINAFGQPIRPRPTLARNIENVQPSHTRHTVTDGSISISFAPDILDQYELWFSPHGESDASSEYFDTDSAATWIEFEIESSSTLRLDARKNQFIRFAGGELTTCGAMVVFPEGQRVTIGNLSVRVDDNGVMQVVSTINEAEDNHPIFVLSTVMIQFHPARHELTLISDLVVTPEWAKSIDLPEIAGVAIGTITVHAQTSFTTNLQHQDCGENSDTGSVAGWVPNEGPDILIASLQSVVRYNRVGGVTAYAIGTTACNIGDERASWISYTNEHPVIIQNIYRLNDDGMQMVGMSWIKHGFYAVSQSVCHPCEDPTDGTQLGVGCSDPYSAPLNGDQYNMSPRSTVNAFTGHFAYPWYGTFDSVLDRRVQVLDEDIDPALNPDARYFLEGHYIAADDAAAGNHDNNASYREVLVFETTPDTFQIFVDSSMSTRRGQPAVRAWQDVDPTVTETDIHVPGEGLFILAAKTTDTGTGMWHYSYALQNLNSDRSGRLFSIPLPPDVVVENIRFRDINYHSGERFDNIDWTYTVDSTSITWSTDTREENFNANALRYSSTYSFMFDANVPPDTTNITLGLFMPGAPMEVLATTLGPALDIIDCNQNEVSDHCDVDCNGQNCLAPCGISIDCNDNGVPDECEPDCNQNAIADACDIRDCAPDDLVCTDCNQNLVPDGCEADCDLDGIPNDCDTPDDTDGDGVTDCFDLCPLTSPPGACVCPTLDRCCYSSGFCISDFPRDACIDQGGIPDCFLAPCRHGCLIGDSNEDGDVDLEDTCMLQHCFSGAKEDAGHITPTQACLAIFDLDDDQDIDLDDFSQFSEFIGGP